MTGVFIKGGNSNTDKNARIKSYEVKTENQVMLLEVKECQRLPAHHHKPGQKHESASPLLPFKGTIPVHEDLIMAFWSPEL